MGTSTADLEKKEERATLTDQERDTRNRQLLADLLSLDIITAKGNPTMVISFNDSFLAKASGKNQEIEILARTIIQFGGDQLMIIPTSDHKAEGSISDSLNQEIWELHMQNVTQALERRKDNLETIKEVIKLISEFGTRIYDILASMRQAEASSITSR